MAQVVLSAGKAVLGQSSQRPHWWHPVLHSHCGEQKATRREIVTGYLTGEMQLATTVPVTS